MTFKQGCLGFVIFFAVIIGFGIIGLATNVISLPFFAANKAVDASKGVIDKTINADNILFNYENFKDMYEGAKQQVANIKKQQASLDDLKKTYGDDAKAWPKDVRENAAFIRQTMDGLNMQYQNVVAHYNADSKKLNRNLFKDKSLPYELPLDPFQLE